MLSILLILVLVPVLCGIGWSIVSRLDSSNQLDDGERLFFSFLVGSYAIYFGVFSIGLIRLDVTTMSGLAGICILAAVPGLRNIPWRNIVGFYVNLRSESGFTKFIAFIIFIVALSSLLQGFAPPNDYDSLLYHLAVPLHDVEVGQIKLPLDSRGFQALFPAMMSNFTRFLLVFADGEAAQLFHGLFGIVAATGSALLLRRFGYTLQIALIGALFFLVIRAVVWQMGTAETDLPLAGFFIAVIILYVVWREKPSMGLSVLFGLMIGGTILTKYTGFALALAVGPLLFFDLLSNKKARVSGFIGPIVSFAVILPHLLRNYNLTGNPIYPLFNAVFNPEAINPYDSVSEFFGTGRGLVDLITAPWNIFVVPMQYYDGMMMGAPYLLVFFPLIVFDKKILRWMPVLLVVATFFLMWFFILTQQVRFLLPIMPLISAMAAVGFAVMRSWAQPFKMLKVCFVVVVAVLVLNQSMFVGIYAALRLPVGMGLSSAAAYHSNTPTMKGAYYKTCSYVRENLRSGETYYSGLIFPSYYCPQANVAFNRFPDEEPLILKLGKLKQYSKEEFLAESERFNFRYYMVLLAHQNRLDVSKNYKSRKNIVARSTAISADKIDYRFKRFLAPAVKSLKPLIQGPNSAVYDGAEVRAELRKLASDR